MVRALLRDPIVRLTGVVLLVVAAPYFAPGLSETQVSLWAAYYSEIPLLAVCLLAIRWGFSRLEDDGERRFWNFWSLAVGAWLVQAIFSAATFHLGALTIAVEFVDNSLFALFYFFAAVALEYQPRQPEDDLARALKSVHRIGTFVFFFGLLLYFAVVPGLLAPDSYPYSSLLLYVALDAYLIVRLVVMLRRSRDPMWRRVYGWLLATTVLWISTDSVEALTWARVIPWLPEGSLIDFAWFPAFVTLVLAARVREVPTPAVVTPDRAARWELGPLVLYAVSFPLIHVALARIATADPELTATREVLALLLLLLLASLVVLHQRLLRERNRRLEVERAESRQRIEHLAFHDELTDLPNRRLLADRVELGLARAHRHQWKLGLLLLDIDDFKAVNDTHGHTVGDEVLRQLARRLRWFVREGDTVARLGGDEFVALLEGLSSEGDAVRVADELARILRSPFEVGGRSLEIGCSIGTAIFPDQGESLETLLRAADAAMYRAKRRPSRLRRVRAGGDGSTTDDT